MKKPASNRISIVKQIHNKTNAIFSSIDFCILTNYRNPRRAFGSGLVSLVPYLGDALGVAGLFK